MSPASGRVLIYRPGALGDTLLALPAIAALRERFRGRHITLACAPTAVPLLRGQQLADAVISADDTTLLPLFGGQVDDIFNSLGPLSAVVLWGGAALRVGADALASRGVQVMHAPSRPAEDADLHVAHHLVASVSEAHGGAIEVPRLVSDPEAAAWVEAELAHVGADKLFAIHPGSGSARKNWSATAFAEVAELVRTELGLDVAIIAGPADEQAVSDTLAAMRRPPTVLAHHWTIQQVAPLLHRTSLFLGNDAGVSHLAGILRTPGIALFGPTRASMWAPLGGTVRAIQRAQMNEHRPFEVFEALRRLSLH